MELNTNIEQATNLLNKLHISPDNNVFILLKDKKALHKWKNEEFRKSLNKDFNQINNHLKKGLSLGLHAPTSNILVIDFDDKKEFKKFIDEYKPDTFVAQTNKGGHIYYKTTNRYKRNATKKVPFLDYQNIDILPSYSGYYKLYFNDENRFILNNTEIKELPKDLEIALIDFLDIEKEKEQPLKKVTNDSTPIINDTNFIIDINLLIEAIKEITTSGYLLNYDEWFKFTSTLAKLIKLNGGTFQEFTSIANLYSTKDSNNDYQYRYWWEQENTDYNNIGACVGYISKVYKQVTKKVANFYKVKTNLLAHYQIDNEIIKDYISEDNIKKHLAKAKELNQNKSLFIASTGSGKTTSFIKYALKNNKRLLFVCPTIPLVKDLERKYIKHNLKEHYIYDDNMNITKIYTNVFGFFHSDGNSLNNINNLDEHLIVITTIDQLRNLDYLHTNPNKPLENNLFDTEELYKIIQPFDLCCLDEIHQYSGYANISTQKETIIYDFLYNEQYKDVANHTIYLTATPFNLPPFKCTSSFIKPLDKKINFLLSDKFTHPNSPTRKIENKVAYNINWIERIYKIKKISPDKKVLIFTNHNSLLVDEEISKQLNKLGYSSECIHSKNAKDKNVMNTNKKYQFKQITIASSILNIGVDFNNDFDIIIVIDNMDINYIIQAINRDRSKDTKVFVCSQNKKQVNNGFMLKKATIRLEDINARKLLNDKGNYYISYNGLYDKLTIELNEFKRVNDYYKDYIKYSLGYLDILDILDFLHIPYEVNFDDFKDIDFTEAKPLEITSEEIKELDSNCIFDFFNPDDVINQFFNKITNFTNKNDMFNQLHHIEVKGILKEDIIYNKATFKNTNLEEQYNLLNSFINTLTNKLRIIAQSNSEKKAIELSEKYAIAIFENKDLFKKKNSFLVINNYLYDVVFNESLTDKYIKDVTDKKLTTKEYKNIMMSIKNEVSFSNDRTSLKEIEKYIKLKGYNIKKSVTTKENTKSRYVLITERKK